jgi:hypothetical protein
MVKKGWRLLAEKVYREIVQLYTFYCSTRLPAVLLVELYSYECIMRLHTRYEYVAVPGNIECNRVTSITLLKPSTVPINLNMTE